MMMRLVPLLLLLAGCATPSQEYFGVPAQTVMRDGREFRVYVLRDRELAQAQVVRMGMAARHEHLRLVDTMISVAEEASGCRAPPGAGQGDSGVFTVRLRCPD